MLDELLIYLLLQSDLENIFIQALTLTEHSSRQNKDALLDPRSCAAYFRICL